MVDGFKFDSKMESEYYVYLKNQKRLKKIKDFELQPEFILQPKFEKNDKKYLPIKYKADFKVIENDDSIKVIDVKGQVLPLFKIKEKMFHYHYEYDLILITYSKIDGGWIEISELNKARSLRKKNKKK